MDQNEDWLEKLNKQMAEESRLLEEYVQKNTEETRKNLEKIDKVKAIFLKQINEMRALRGEGPIEL